VRKKKLKKETRKCETMEEETRNNGVSEKE
jgi:hypothetical protein